MDTRICLGRAALRRLFEVTREVAGCDLALGTRLLEHLRDRGALRLDAGGFAEFDNRRARACLPEFLAGRTSLFTLPMELVPDGARQELAIWEKADLPLPLGGRLGASPFWLSVLLGHGLVRPGPRGLRMSPRLRLHLWLTEEEGKTSPAQRSPLIWEALRTLRRQGRWHEAARWAQVVVEFEPSLLDRHPSLLITIALGYTQSQNYAWLDRWFETMHRQGHLTRWLGRTAWSVRLEAVRELVLIESGHQPLRRRHESAEARFWFALVSCWGSLYAGRYRRALRLLDFLQGRRPAQLDWLDQVMQAWRATALHYLERYLESKRCNQLALEQAARLGWRERELVMLRNLALAHFENGEVEQALAILKGQEHRNMVEHRLTVLPGVWNLQAHIMNLRVRFGTGAWLNRAARQLGHRSGVMHQVLYFREGQAVRARRCGEDRLAEQLFLDVEEFAVQIADELARGNAVWNRARLAWCRSEPALALALLDRAESLFKAMHQPTRQGDMRCDRAMFFLEAGHFEAAEREIQEAEALYGLPFRPREAALLQLLRLELRLRRAPESLSESQLDWISQHEADTVTRTAYSYSLVALGFALLGDRDTGMLYGKETLFQVNRLGDPFISSHILNLGSRLRNRSRTASELVSYWFETFPFHGDTR